MVWSKNTQTRAEEHWDFSNSISNTQKMDAPGISARNNKTDKESLNPVDLSNTDFLTCHISKVHNTYNKKQSVHGCCDSSKISRQFKFFRG